MVAHTTVVIVTMATTSIGEATVVMISEETMLAGLVIVPGTSGPLEDQRGGRWEHQQGVGGPVGAGATSRSSEMEKGWGGRRQRRRL